MNPQNEDIGQTLRAMCGGSTEAFDRFYARYAPLVLHIARKVVGDPMEAEDICHDIFLEVLRKGNGYDPTRGSVEAWLAVMTRSRSMDRLRKDKRLVRTNEAAEPAGQYDSAAGTEDLVLLRLQREALEEAMQTLPSRQREAVAFSYYTAHTQKELSEAWDVPLGTVKSWVRYGLSNMRKQMEKRGWRSESGTAAIERRSRDD